MKHFITFSLLNFMLGFSFARADSLSSEIPSQLSHSEQAIWKIYSFEKDESEAHRVKGYGTGFFIGPNRFITNFHIIFSISSQLGENINIMLVQEDMLSVLTIRKVIAVSALYDLALLETEQHVTDYLDIREEAPESSEDLFLIAYPGIDLKRIKKTGGIYYGDKQHYIFPVNHSVLDGASGAPVLDKQGKVVGVVSSSTDRVLNVIKANYLMEFITGSIGVRCYNFNYVDELIRSVGTRVCVKKGIERLEEEAKKGLALAQYQLAMIYHDGKDMNKALLWMQQAAQQGYVLAQYQLAMIHYTDKSIDQDMNKAFHWIQKAAQQGYAPAQYQLALKYYNGKGVDQNLDEAFHWTEKAAQQGYVSAQYNLAVIYYTGEIVEKNTNKAFLWFQQAAQQGHAPAQFRLALMYHNGKEVDKDLSQALYWFEKASEQGHVDAKEQLDLILKGQILNSELSGNLFP